MSERKIELVKAWIKKAENDLLTAKHMINVGESPPFDVVCFHAQQSAEKYIKVFLVYSELEFEKTHDLGELIERASTIDKDFLQILELGDRLTDYAVGVRYPLVSEEPTFEEAQEAIRMAEEIKEFVLKKLPL